VFWPAPQRNARNLGSRGGLTGGAGTPKCFESFGTPGHGSSGAARSLHSGRRLVRTQQSTTTISQFLWLEGAEFSCALLPFLFATPRSPGSVKTHRQIPASPHNRIGSAPDKFCPPPPTPRTREWRKIYAMRDGLADVENWAPDFPLEKRTRIFRFNRSVPVGLHARTAQTPSLLLVTVGGLAALLVGHIRGTGRARGGHPTQTARRTHGAGS
jgi:hypothetical protein